MMCGGKNDFGHLIGFGRACSFMWKFMKYEKVPDQLVFDEYGRCRAIQLDDYYQLLPLSSCANFMLLMNVLLLAPFFIYCFFSAIVDGMVMPMYCTAGKTFATEENQPNEGTSCCRTLLRFVFCICIFPFLFLMLALTVVSIALNCAFSVLVFVPRVVYLVFLWCKWTCYRNRHIRKLSRADE